MGQEIFTPIMQGKNLKLRETGWPPCKDSDRGFKHQAGFEKERKVVK